MLYIYKIDEYLKILIDEKVKDFVAINFSESIKEKQNLRKVAKWPYSFQQHLMKYNQIPLIIIYDTAMLKFQIVLIQN